MSASILNMCSSFLSCKPFNIAISGYIVLVVLFNILATFNGTFKFESVIMEVGIMISLCQLIVKFSKVDQQLL